MPRRYLTGLAVVVLVGVVAVACADIIETSGYRAIDARSEAGPFGGTTLDDPLAIEDFSYPPPDTVFIHALTSSADGSEGRTSASGDASQHTTLASGHYFGTLATVASAINNGGDWADGWGESELSVSFTLDATYDVHIVGTYEVFEEGTGASAAVQALLLGDEVEVILDQWVTGSGEHDFWLQLEPGSYTFDMTVLSSANRIVNPGTDNAHASYEFEYTIIPEPAGVALLAIGVVGLRRLRT